MSEIPRIGLIVLQEPILTASAPSIMYGPEEMRSRPYVPGLFSKHLPTSAGSARPRAASHGWRKSPVGRVRVNAIVFAFGVAMPEIDRRPARFGRRRIPG